MGTIAYMSPEQARGESMDARTDIWSLGIVIFELLTGSLPFKGDHEQALVYSILNAEPLRTSDLRREVPVELEKIVEKAMEKGQGERYQNMYELVKDLEEVGRKIEAGEVRKRLFRFRLRKKDRRIAIIAASAFLVVAAGLSIFLWRWSASRAAPATIAVFTNPSNDASLDWFTAGLRDILVTDLTKISRLRVKSADRTMDLSKGLRDIAKQLGADYVLDVSVLRAGDKVRVTATLIDGRTDENVWAEKYEKGLNDVMGVQGEITRAVVGNIRIEVTPEEKALLEGAAAVKPGAYESYLKGVFYAKKMTVENERRSIDYFTKAIAEDPAYAPSYARLAGAWQTLGSAEMGVVLPSESAQKAEAAAQEALSKNKLLGDPHRVLGQVKRDFGWDFAAAGQELSTALERNPSDAEALAQRALLQVAQGQLKEALESATQAQKIDPLTLWFSSVTGFMYACLGRWEESDRETQKALDFNAEFAFTHATRGTVFLMRGKYADAAASLEKAVSLMEEWNPVVKARLGYACAKAGRGGEAQKILAELEARPKEAYTPAVAYAMVYAGLGDAMKTFEWLEKAFQEKAPQLIYLKVNPEWTELRGDLRFADLVRKVGLEK
jgi:TolB-like protein/Tfp pilus assembly protein PilF